MQFYRAVDIAKRNSRNEEVTGKKPLEWAIINNSEAIERTYNAYASDNSINPKVTIMDQMYYANVATMEVRPIYWEGPVYEMRRGLWYTELSSKYYPCEDQLAIQLEFGYLKYEKGLQSISNPDEYKKYPLDGPYSAQFALYTNSTVAFLVYDDMPTKVAQAVVSKLSSGKDIWGTKVIRGMANVPKEKQPASPMKTGVKTPNIPRPDKQDITPCHLVLVIHGIGQKYFNKSGMYTFENDVGQLRERIENSMDDLKIKDRYMILPIQWREIVEFEVESVKEIEKDLKNKSPSTIESDTDTEGGDGLQNDTNDDDLPRFDDIMIPTNPFGGLIKDVA